MNHIVSNGLRDQPLDVSALSIMGIPVVAGGDNGLNGNIFPGTATTADYVLRNTDGAGACLWEDDGLVGNVMPNPSATVGSILTNSDGAGACTWAIGPSSGSYTPSVTIASNGGTILTGQTLAHWSKVGNVLTVGGSFGVTLEVGYQSFQAVIPIPSGSVNGAGGIMGSGGGANNGNANSTAVFVQQADFSATSVHLTFRASALSNFTVAQGTTCTFSFSCLLT
jgi:hypothetical protein